MMTLEKLFRCGVRMLIAGAALHGLGQMVLAEDVESAEFETSNVSRSKQVSLVSQEKAPPPPRPLQPKHAGPPETRTSPPRGMAASIFRTISRVTWEGAASRVKTHETRDIKIPSNPGGNQKGPIMRVVDHKFRRASRSTVNHLIDPESV